MNHSKRQLLLERLQDERSKRVIFLHELRRKHLSVRWYEHDLLSEIRGEPICLRTKKE